MKLSIEDVLEPVLIGLIPVLISFLVSNIAVVLVVLLAVVVLLAAVILRFQHKAARQLLGKAAARHEQSASYITEVITSNRFKDLELGLVQGETQRRLSGLEKAAFSLQRRCEQLSGKLKAQRVPFFAILGPYYQVKSLEREVNELAALVDEYRRDLSGMDQLSQTTGELGRRAKQKLDAAERLLAGIAKDTGYPLDELQAAMQQVRQQWKQAEHHAAFDAVQAKAEFLQLDRLLEATEARMREVKSSAALLEQMKVRLQAHKGPLLKLIEDGRSRTTPRGKDPQWLLQQTDRIIEKLEASLRAGQSVNLPTAAGEMEQLIQEAAALIEEAEHNERRTVDPPRQS